MHQNISVSLVFSMASGYREIYKYYLMLQKGLNINSNIFAISMKDLPLLYEYWCFIKINSLLRKKYKLISSDFIKVNNEGIEWLFVRGRVLPLYMKILELRKSLECYIILILYQGLLIKSQIIFFLLIREKALWLMNLYLMLNIR